MTVVMRPGSAGGDNAPENNSGQPPQGVSTPSQQISTVATTGSVTNTTSTSNTTMKVPTTTPHVINPDAPLNQLPEESDISTSETVGSPVAGVEATGEYIF